jgi:hypothetical protein
MQAGAKTVAFSFLLSPFSCVRSVVARDLTSFSFSFSSVRVVRSFEASSIVYFRVLSCRVVRVVSSSRIVPRVVVVRENDARKNRVADGPRTPERAPRRPVHSLDRRAPRTLEPEPLPRAHGHREPVFVLPREQNAVAAADEPASGA